MLAALMVKHDITHIKLGSLEMTRAPKNQDSQAQESEFDKVRKLPFDQQEAFFIKRQGNV